MHACVCVCVRACMHACVHVCVCVERERAPGAGSQQATTQHLQDSGRSCTEAKWRRQNLSVVGVSGTLTRGPLPVLTRSASPSCLQQGLRTDHCLLHCALWLLPLARLVHLRVPTGRSPGDLTGPRARSGAWFRLEPSGVHHTVCEQTPTLSSRVLTRPHSPCP